MSRCSAPSPSSTRKRTAHLQGSTSARSKRGGATSKELHPASAIWQYGVLRDPYDPQLILDRRIPVDRLLTADSIEAWLDRAELLKGQIATAEQSQASGQLPLAEGPSA